MIMEVGSHHETDHRGYNFGICDCKGSCNWLNENHVIVKEMVDP